MTDFVTVVLRMSPLAADSLRAQKGTNPSLTVNVLAGPTDNRSSEHWAEVVAIGSLPDTGEFDG